MGILLFISRSLLDKYRDRSYGLDLGVFRYLLALGACVLFYDFRGVSNLTSYFACSTIVLYLDL